ncbi:MAG: tRNA threonylcarbamoyladenosine biosynthesis protein RimN [Lysobacterales bacterium]|nr:MAG: tRNA threonylcarbamoyladenosine biosynthesis protein RimN [Xanthomonadales bacterium]
MGRLRIARAARIVRGGGVIAYPTEAVFGLGCLPLDRRAVMRVLAIKQRSWRKGLILIGASVEQLERYVVLPPEPRRGEVLATWPGPHTWVLDALQSAPRWITGGRSSVAVRVTAHPVAAELCRSAGEALVSTSANVSRRPPHRRLLLLRRDLGHRVDYILAGPLGGLAQPTVIRDGRSGAVLRA